MLEKIQCWSTQVFYCFHVQVAAILQSPGEWMLPADQRRESTSEQPTQQPTVPQETSEEGPDPRGDPEMAPVYLRRLLPVFCTTFQATMLGSVR